jgi:hypothetical protein
VINFGRAYLVLVMVWVEVTVEILRNEEQKGVALLNAFTLVTTVLMSEQ